MITVRKRFTFDAAHQLPNHLGKCSHPHGHTYTVEVAVSAPEPAPLDGRSDEGMVVDFEVLKCVWKDYLEPHLDHQDLNSSLAGVVPVTTAESLASWVWGIYDACLPDLLSADREHRVKLESVTVWETASCSATVT